MKRFIYLFLISSLLCCCKVAEKLSLERIENNGNFLKIDGYFFHEYESGYVTFFLYRNGIFYETNAILDIENLTELDKYILENHSEENAVQLHWFWGIYNISSDKISINHWLPGTGGPYPAQVSEGEILNDETILISGLRGMEYENKLDTFKFRYLSSKPDSTNLFIE